MTRAIPPVIVLAFATFCSAAIGFDEKPKPEWTVSVGDKVVPRSLGFRFRNGFEGAEWEMSSKLDSLNPIVVLSRIEIENREPLVRLRLPEFGLIGWASEDEVVCIEEFDRYFAGRITANPKDTEALFLRCTYHENVNGDFDTSLEQLDEVIRLAPDFAIAYARRGKLKFLTGDIEEAEKDWKTAAGIAPTESIIFIHRIEALKAVSSPDKDQIRNALEDLIHISPDSCYGHLELAEVHCQEGDFTTALKHADTAIRCMPKMGLSYALRARIYDEIGEFDKSAADYATAITLDPYEAFSYSSRAFCHMRRKEIAAAEADYDKAISLDPENAVRLMERAWFRIENKRYREALVDIDQALRILPSNASAYSLRGVAHAYLKEIPQAIADYSMAIAIEPENTEHYEGRANLFSFIGDLEKAIDDYEAALELAPDDIQLQIGRRFVYFENGQFARAASEFAAKIDLDADGNDTLLFALMELASLERSGKLDQARIQAKRYATSYDRNQWPFPLLSIFMDDADENQLLTAAAAIDKENAEDDAVNMTRLLLAHHALASNEKEKAIKQFRWFLDNSDFPNRYVHSANLAIEEAEGKLPAEKPASRPGDMPDGSSK
jgi:tetratricopeptide (TPR) repeat protein